MNQRHKFAPLKTRPNLNPKAFDPNAQTFVPDLSLTNSKVHDVGVEKVRVIGCKVYSSVTQSIPSNSDFHDLEFDTTVYDTANIFDGTSTFTIPRAGIWALTAFASFEAETAETRRIQIRKGATELIRFGAAGIDGIQTDLLVTADFLLEQGDTVKAFVSQDSATGALDVQDGEDDNFFCITYRGPI